MRVERAAGGISRKVGYGRLGQEERTILVGYHPPKEQKGKSGLFPEVAQGMVRARVELGMVG